MKTKVFSLLFLLLCRVAPTIDITTLLNEEEEVLFTTHHRSRIGLLIDQLQSWNMVKASKEPRAIELLKSILRPVSYLPSQKDHLCI